MYFPRRACAFHPIAVKNVFVDSVSDEELAVV